MKKINIILILITLGYSSMAQLGEASILAGGSLGLNSEQFTSDSRYTSYSVQPALGYVLASDKVVGLSVSLSGSKVTYDPDMEDKSTNIEAGVFYRKYNSITEKLFFNWQIAAGILSQTHKGAVTETHSLGFGTRFSPGLTWVATNKLLVVSRVGNLSYFQKTGDVEGGALNVSFNSLSLGLEFLLK